MALVPRLKRQSKRGLQSVVVLHVIKPMLALGCLGSTGHQNPVVGRGALGPHIIKKSKLLCFTLTLQLQVQSASKHRQQTGHLRIIRYESLVISIG
jgi:hypothetical protein